MSKGFNEDKNSEFEYIDNVQELLKKYKKIKKYQKSSLFAVKTMEGTEDYVSKLVEEGEELGNLTKYY
jgi:hypothetical protein